MSKYAVHSFVIFLAAAAHMAAYWAAMSRSSFEWSAFSNFLPFLLIVGAIVASAAAVNTLIHELWLNRTDSTVNVLRFSVIYLIWFVSAFSLYVMNKGVDAYSATLGVFIYMPLHAGAVFIINLFMTAIFKLFAQPEIKN